jgi:hypothetical protein
MRGVRFHNGDILADNAKLTRPMQRVSEPETVLRLDSRMETNIFFNRVPWR